MPVTDPSADNIAAWGRLHAEPRHQLRYPSEHVVRWLAGLRPIQEGDAIDIGCGSGRHIELMRAFDFEPIGVDVVQAAGDYVADMRDLPFADRSFDIALAYAVFYYGTKQDGQQAVRELHRVLAPGGHALITMRTSQDWRRNGIPAGEPEHGMTMHFPTALELRQTYADFTEFNLELEQVSTHSLSRVNSNWLITVTK